MTSVTQDTKFFFNFLDNFVLLVTLEFLSNYPDNIHNIKILFWLHWLNEDVQWITDKKNFRENLMIQLASTFSSRTFRLNFGFRLFLFSYI